MTASPHIGEIGMNRLPRLAQGATREFYLCTECGALLYLDAMSTKNLLPFHKCSGFPQKVTNVIAFDVWARRIA